MRQQLLNYIVENPVRYIASIPVFAYKGMWFLKGSVPLLTKGIPLFNILAMLCFLGLFFFALFTRKQALVAALGLAVGLFLFMAMFSHALTRYTAAMTPFVLLSTVWVIAALTRWAYGRFPRARAFVDRLHAAVSAHERCEQGKPALPDCTNIERRDCSPRLSRELRAQQFVRDHPFQRPLSAPQRFPALPGDRICHFEGSRLCRQGSPQRSPGNPRRALPTTH